MPLDPIDHAWLSPDPPAWCKTREDLVSWCLDEVTEEPRVGAEPYRRFLARCVSATLEMNVPEEPSTWFNGQLFYSPWQTQWSTGRLSGELFPTDPSASPISVTVNLRRNASATLVIGLSGYTEQASLPAAADHFANPPNEPPYWDGLGMDLNAGPFTWLLLTPAYVRAG